MYMAMIGMAIIAVPRGIIRGVAWLVMVVVGWLLSAAEYAFAEAAASFSGGQITVTCDQDNDPDTVRIYFVDGGMNPDSVLVSDGVSSPSLMTNNPAAVSAILVNGDSAGDSIVLDVFPSDGFSGLDGNITINGGYGDDTIHGSDFADLIIGESGADLMYGHVGNDTAYHLTPGAGTASDGAPDEFYGGDGTDTFVGNTIDDDDQGFQL